MRTPPQVAPLTDEEVARLPEGASVVVMWERRAGVYSYTVRVDEHGVRHAWASHLESSLSRSPFRNPLRNARVWWWREDPQGVLF